MRRTTRAAAAVLAAGILLAGCADDGADTGDVVEDPATGEMVEDLEGVDPDE